MCARESLQNKSGGVDADDGDDRELKPLANFLCASWLDGVCSSSCMKLHCTFHIPPSSSPWPPRCFCKFRFSHSHTHTMNFNTIFQLRHCTIFLSLQFTSLCSFLSVTLSLILFPSLSHHTTRNETERFDWSMLRCVRVEWKFRSNYLEHVAYRQH